MVKVACCWDDGVETDIRLVEILQKYGVKATFNINSGLHYQKYRRVYSWQFADHPDFVNRLLSIEEMKTLYRGFKIGAHGVFHLSYVPEKFDEFITDIAEDKDNLENIFQCSVPGMAYPCGLWDEKVADKLREKGFLYGRTVVRTDDVGAYKHPLALGTSCHFLEDNFFAKFAAAKANNGIFYFWGHSCEMQNVPEKWAEFEKRMAYISADSETKFIDVVDIVRHDI